ncbi:MAG: SRPBCC family protein [Marmoricola sp.]
MTQTTSTATATVPRTSDHVWSVLVDHEGMSSWAPGLTVTLTSQGAPERNGLGAVRRITTPGPAPAIVEEVTVFDEGTTFGYRALAGVPFKNYGGTVTLTPQGGSTRVDYAITLDERVPVVEKLAAAAVARVLLAGLVRAAKR